jgi:single-strand DNA-binding protein
MNDVKLLGNLASDVEIKDVSEGRQVASFLLAVNRRGENAGADFIRVETWNGTAKACNTYLSKGARVLVDGAIRTSRYTKDDETRYSFKVSAGSVQFLSPKAGTPEGHQTDAAPPQTDDDIPF